MDIKIIVLAPGERAPQSADWISIETLPKGRYNVAGCVAGEHQVAFANEMFKSFEDAKLAGVFWARHLGATAIYVESNE
jgi:hypothetical protein